MNRYLIVIFSCMFLTANGQVNTDSLRAVWNNITLPDSVRLQSINILAWEGFLFSNPDSAFYYAQLQFDFAREKGRKKEMAVARNTQGTSYYMSGNYAQAIEYFYKSLKLKEEINDLKGIAATMNNIGMIYDEQGDHAKAIEHYTKSIEYINSIQLDENSHGSIETLVASYHNLGALYSGIKEYDKAIEYFEKTLEIAEEHNFPREQAYTYSNLGQIYLEDDKDKSLNYFDQAYKILTTIGDENGVIDALNNFGIFYLAQSDFQKALAYSHDALSKAQQSKAISQINKAAQNLYLSYKNLGNHSNALEYYELYISTRDTLQSEKNQEEVLRQEYEYAYEKKAAADSTAFAAMQEIQNLKISEQQAQLSFQEARNQTLYSIVALLIILALSGYYFFNRKIRDNKIIIQQKSEVEKQRDKITRQNDLLAEKNQKITELNNNLEILVEERTRELEQSLNQIRAYQFNLAHNIRAPYATLVGLINLIEDERFDKGENKKVLQKLHETNDRIKEVLHEISSELIKIDGNKSS